MNKFLKYLLAAAGLISLAAGITGIFVPVLPTTPFLLLSAFCFGKSSEKLHSWLLNHKIFGSYLTNYIKYRAIKRKAKIITLVLFFLTIALSFVFTGSTIVRIILILIGITVGAHILSLQTIESIEIEKQCLREPSE